MVTPTNAEIEERAREIHFSRDPTGTYITPERAELSEAGHLREAQDDLMRGPSKTLSAQEQYLAAMAHEMGLKVLEQDEYQDLRKEISRSRGPGSAISNTPAALASPFAVDVALSRLRDMIERDLVISCMNEQIGASMQQVRNLSQVMTIQWKRDQEFKKVNR